MFSLSSDMLGGFNCNWAASANHWYNKVDIVCDGARFIDRDLFGLFAGLPYNLGDAGTNAGFGISLLPQILPDLHVDLAEKSVNIRILEAIQSSASRSALLF
jgi:hypothetical protein